MGATLNVRLFGAYWLNLGATYRFGGYDTTDAVNDNTIYLERTRANFLDFPVLIRYTGPHFRWNRYSFYEVGGAMRYATHVDLQQSANNGTSYYCCAPPSTTTISGNIFRRGRGDFAGPAWDDGAAGFGSVCCSVMFLSSLPFFRLSRRGLYLVWRCAAKTGQREIRNVRRDLLDPLGQVRAGEREGEDEPA